VRTESNAAGVTERFIEVADHYHVWAQAIGPADTTPVLLIMGANSSAVAWPDDFVARLAERHRVIRYDHRDTGRSTWAFTQRPYAIRDLAADAVGVLDAFDIERAHVVGMSMGGLLVQLLLIDHPQRMRSATLFCTTALATGGGSHATELPEPDPRLVAMWEHMGEPRNREAELDWRVEHWRLLNGDQLDFDPETFRRWEQRAIDHAGRHESPTAHALADQSGLERGDQLANVDIPTLVIEAPADPINPPPHAARLADAIKDADVVTIPNMGHALNPAILRPLADTVLRHIDTIDQSGSRDHEPSL
jgi:pimeloyl-ACP methyl ester carboxylesterase